MAKDQISRRDGKRWDQGQREGLAMAGRSLTSSYWPKGRTNGGYIKGIFSVEQGIKNL